MQQNSIMSNDGQCGEASITFSSSTAESSGDTRAPLNRREFAPEFRRLPPLFPDLPKILKRQAAFLSDCCAVASSAQIDSICFKALQFFAIPLIYSWRKQAQRSLMLWFLLVETISATAYARVPRSKGNRVLGICSTGRLGAIVSPYYNGFSSNVTYRSSWTAKL